jgi:hypothetical protein
MMSPTGEAEDVMQNETAQTTVEVPTDTTESKVDIVALSDDGPVTTKSYAQQSSEHIVSVENCTYTLADILNRPIDVASFNYSVADSQDSIIMDLRFPDTIYAQQLWNSKMVDFRFFKCCLEFKFVANCQKFDAGKLWIYWEPNPPVGTVLESQSWPSNYTGYNGVELDLASDESIVFRVPFISSNTHVDMLEGNSFTSWGRLRCRVLNTFQTASSTSCDVTVYLHLTQLQLKTPTTNNVLPFLASDKRIRPKRERIKAAMSAGIQGQMGDSERATRNDGPISKVAGLVSKVSSGISSFGIPYISGAANTLSWISAMVGKVASALGYSKPLSDQLLAPMQNIPGKGFTNFDKLDNSVKLAHTTLNAVRSGTSDFGVEDDEMDLKYIARRMCVVDRFLWSDAYPEDTMIGFVPVTPGWCSSTAGPPVTFRPTVIGYVGSMFDLWRGAVRIKLSFVKNEFYAGRLVAAFFSGTTLPTASDLPYLPRVVIDLQKKSEYTLCVPFISNTHYKKFHLTDGTNGDLTQNSILGYLTFFVLNRLKHPANVSASISANVWLGMCDDIEFAGPQIGSYNLASTPQPLLGKSKQHSQPAHLDIEGQMGSFRSCDMADHVFFCESVGETNSFAVQTVGERITNLRQLTRRFNILMTDGSSPTNFLLDPWCFDVAGTAMEYVAALFRQFRGSVRFKVLIVSGTETLANYTITALLDRTSSSAVSLPAPSAAANGLINGAFRHIVDSSRTGMLEVEVPQYSTKSYVFIVPSGTNVAVDDFRTKVRIIPYPVLAAGDIMQVYTALGDDASFGFLAGAPEVVYVA